MKDIYTPTTYTQSILQEAKLSPVGGSIVRRLHEAQVSMTYSLGKQMGHTKTARYLRIKCPMHNHYHCCKDHVCD